jgi:glycosyltransferase involved in cell wall biosynthesis
VTTAVPPRRLKVALINNLYPPYIVGGNEMLACEVVGALRRRGHEVHVLTGHGPDLEDDGYTHQVLDLDLSRKADVFLGGLPLTMGRLIKWHLFNARSYREVLATLRRLEPDLVIAWNLYMASSAPLIAARRLTTPVLAHPADKWLLYLLKDITLLMPGRTRPTAAGMRLIKQCIQPVLNALGSPDYLLAVSEFIRRLHTNAGFPESRSKATHLGVPCDRFPYVEREFPEHRPWRFLFAGQLWAGKGPQVAVRAMAMLKERSDLPAASLNIYGDGTEGFKAYLRQLIEEHRVGDCVTLHGFVPQAQLAQEFQRHDAYLFCSIWDEPFSGGLLEAMATGLPTIATTAGGTPEAVVHDVNGLLVPPDDPEALAAAMARLMQGPDVFKRLGSAAAVDVREKWTFGGYIDRLEAAYRQIVESHRPGRPTSLSRSSS